MNIRYKLSDKNKNVDNTEFVTGNQRWKYHTRPLVPLIIEEGDQFGLEGGQDIDEYPDQEEEKFQEDEAPFKTIGVQTVFRESSTQTHPFSREKHIPKGTNPEILLLEFHEWGAGLPATMEEMYFIEENREKLAFEGALPPTSDEASFILRRKLMEEQEIKEWKKRENEIKRVQNERLNLLQSALIEREKEIEEQNMKRVESIKVKKMESKNRLIAKIQRKKIKILRKILKRKKAAKMSGKRNLKRDVVKEYHNFASRVYANITREGLSLDKLSNQFQVQPYSLEKYENFSELCHQIPEKQFKTVLRIEDFVDSFAQKYTKLENKHRADLKEAQDEITGAENNNKDNDNQKIGDKNEKNKNVRRGTPIHEFRPYGYLSTIVKEFAEDPNTDPKNTKDGPYGRLKDKFNKREEIEEAVVFLQKLIKGRAMQNSMFDGKEKRLALIEELLIVHNIDEIKKEKEQELLMEQHKQRVKNAFLEGIQGEAIAETLEDLSKELLRFKEEKKIYKYVEKAEQERRRREAEETGTRQAELMLRSREDVLYSEIMKVHQGTVDGFLTRVMGRSVNHLASQQAIIMARLRQHKFERAIKNTRKQETLIKDLVSSFLVPNIERSRLRRIVNLEQNRYSEAVKNTMLHSMKGVQDHISHDK